MSDDTETETLRLLRDTVAGFAKFDGPRVRALRAEPGKSAGRIDRAKWSAIADQGWLAVLVPEADGGLDLGIGAAAVIAERLGYGCVPEPFIAGGVIAPYLLGRATNAALKQRVLPKVLSGETIATLAWQGEAGSLSLDEVHVTASESNKEAILNGTSRFVPAPGADAFLVATRRPDGLALYWVDRAVPGLQVTLEPLADGGASGWLRLTKVHVPAANVVAGPAQAGSLITAAIDLALIVQSAELTGNMERSLEMTLDYLRVRKQFGQAIGSFQVLQHRAVDLWMHKELSRHAVTAAVRIASARGVMEQARGAAASSAKNRAAESAMLVAKQAIQLHGAIGTTDEYDLGLFVNRCVALVPWLGNAMQHRQRYGALAPARERLSAHA
jgi:alkylation response protein AidB-like acyl-CoA dehydrogenase